MRRSLFAITMIIMLVMPASANVLRMYLNNGMEIIYVTKGKMSHPYLQKHDGQRYVEVDDLIFDKVSDLDAVNVSSPTEVGLPERLTLRPGYLYLRTNEISKMYPFDAENVDINVLYQDGITEIDLSDLLKGSYVVRTGSSPETYNSFVVKSVRGSVGNRSGFMPYWLFGLHGGGTMAFGDDSYHVFRDYKDATGYVLGFNVGYQFSRLIGARLSASYAKLYSRVNLETLDLFGSLYPKYFPRNGFYGYETLSLQAQAMLNFLNIFSYNPLRKFDIYLYGGVGLDNFSNYDRHVGAWSQSAAILPGGWYNVDTGNRTQFSGTIGGSLNYWISNEVRLDLDIIGTITGDNMEGVVYDDPYDVYITYTLGFSVRF